MVDTSSTEEKIVIEHENKVEESLDKAFNTEDTKAINLSKEDKQETKDKYNEDEQFKKWKDSQKQYQDTYTQQKYNQSKQAYNPDIVTPDKLKVEPIIATIISIVIPGLSQMINGQIEKGLIIMVGGYLAVCVITLMTCGIGAILSPILSIFAALDAYQCADRLHNGQSIRKYEYHIL